VSVGSVAVGDEVGSSFQTPICLLTQVTGGAGVAGCGCDAGERIEGEHLDRGIVLPSGLVENGLETSFSALSLIRGVHGGQQALAERGLLATASSTVPGSGGF
jgi:hypothetical protein